MKPTSLIGRIRTIDEVLADQKQALCQLRAQCCEMLTAFVRTRMQLMAYSVQHGPPSTAQAQRADGRRAELKRRFSALLAAAGGLEMSLVAAGCWPHENYPPLLPGQMQKKRERDDAHIRPCIEQAVSDATARARALLLEYGLEAEEPDTSLPVELLRLIDDYRMTLWSYSVNLQIAHSIETRQFG